MNMVIQNPKNEDHWGYWERVMHMLPDEHVSISDADKNKRIGKFLKNIDPYP